jgi:hypothetical protein
MAKHDVIVDDLLKQLGESRESIKLDITKLVSYETKIDAIFPTEANYRNKWAVQEKVKAITEFLNSKLRLKQELNKVIKDEITLRRQDKTEEGVMKPADVRKLAVELTELTSKSADKETPEPEQNIKV